MDRSRKIDAARAQWRYVGRERPLFAREPGPGQRSVWEFPRPPAIESVADEVSVDAGDALLARTRRALRVLETASPPTYYLPPEDVQTARLAPAQGRSFCEWKGEARYWRLAHGDETVAWSYPEPFAEFARIRNWFSFYPGRVACRVGEVHVEAQSGGFYGGWITPDLVGPFKGEPGTEGM